MNPLSRTPILALLIPLIAGILLQYFLDIQPWAIAFFGIGAVLALLSYFIPSAKRFQYRWLFGIGINLLVIGIGILATAIRQQETSFIFSAEQNTYKAVVTDIPEDKPKTIAYKAYLPDYDRSIVCYFYRDSIQQQLVPGDEFLFKGKIQPFHNMSNDFDYASYMGNHGFAGSVFVGSKAWQATDRIYHTPKIYAQRCRASILEFYQSLDLSSDQYAILSALSVGYQAAMSDDLLQAFRTTGTVHVLSVSGLHVMLIYAMINLLLKFIPRRSRFYVLKPIIVILLLWIYAFITGLSPAVNRASIMLTMICVAEIFGRRNYALNGMFIAAFLLLLYNPLSFFDVGFQLSFLSVFALIYLYPKVQKLITVQNKAANLIWQSFTISVVAQLATFPLCLYYFGTFPTYFFATNLVIVPLVTILMYSFGGILFAKLLSMLTPLGDSIVAVIVKLVQILLDVLSWSVRFFESIPFALIENVKINLFQLLALYLIIGCLSAFIFSKKAFYMKSALGCILIFIISKIIYL